MISRLKLYNLSLLDADKFNCNNNNCNINSSKLKGKVDFDIYTEQNYNHSTAIDIYFVIKQTLFKL